MWPELHFAEGRNRNCEGRPPSFVLKRNVSRLTTKKSTLLELLGWFITVAQPYCVVAAASKVHVYLIEMKDHR